jgi:hypothetical protein
MGAAQTPPDHGEDHPSPLQQRRWWPATPEIGLFDPDKVRTTRYRYRGTAIPTPWPATG